ncbi:MAG: PIN domain-containing protein [Kiritimatiellae bacterium]|nr:PIN domain-containing protein [Kiritimatiellia bacterium]
MMVDSNVFIHFLRKNLDPLSLLQSWIDPSELVTCGMVRMEVERGITGQKLRRRVSAFFDLLRFVPTSNQIWANATEMAWTLDRRGKILPAQDLLIAAHALKFGGSILTADRHFYEIPGMKVFDPAEEFPEWDAD